jgi:Phage integrase, N-terminal SAM-like domain
MSESSDSPKFIERMKVHMQLRGLRPSTIYTFTNRARRFLAQVARAPIAVTTEDVEGFLLDLARQARSPRTRNVYLAAIRCLLAATLAATLADAGRVIIAAIPNAKPTRRCPEILSGTEVARLLDLPAQPRSGLTQDCMSIRNHSGVEGGVPSDASVYPALVTPATTGLRSRAGSGSAPAIPRDHDASMVDQAAIGHDGWLGSRTTICRSPSQVADPPPRCRSPSQVADPPPIPLPIPLPG